MRKLMAGLALAVAALASGCIIVPVGERHHGYYDGPRGDSVTIRYSDDDHRGYHDRHH